MSMLQAVNGEKKKSRLYTAEFEFLNKLVIYLYKAPGTLHNIYTYVHMCMYLKHSR